MYVCKNTYTHTYVHKHLYKDVDMQANSIHLQYIYKKYMNIYVCTLTHAYYIDMHTHTHTHTCTHTHTHTHTQNTHTHACTVQY